MGGYSEVVLIGLSYVASQVSCIINNVDSFMFIFIFMNKLSFFFFFALQSP